MVGKVRTWRPEPHDLEPETRKEKYGWDCHICKRRLLWAEQWDYYDHPSMSLVCCLDCARKEGWVW